MSPMLVSIIFVLAVVVLCFAKPNAGRIFLGLFFLLMALGVNGSFTFGNPQAYIDYAEGALIPLYRNLVVPVVSISPFLFGLLVMAFEITMGLLLLHKHKSVKIGLIGTMLFLAGMAPLDWLQLPWLGLIVAEVYLFKFDFDRSLIEMILRKPHQRISNA
ncbi:hypothetical protein FBQ99_22455 [Chloroflexi bacterium CFX2]|nr:hypothetical protein [Chloroflexi bacterium CFX2]